MTDSDGEFYAVELDEFTRLAGLFGRSLAHLNSDYNDSSEATTILTQGAIELYDLSEDPGEERDVSTHHRETVERMRKYLDNARTPSPNWPIPEVA